MKLSRIVLVLALVSVAVAGCKLKESDQDATGAIPAPPDVAAPPANAITTASGLAFKVLTVGLGTAHPMPSSTVVIHYTVWSTDGKMIESSVPSRQPATFGVKDLNPGLTEGLPLMVVGEKRRFWIPSELAYKDGMRVFDVELISVK